MIIVTAWLVVWLLVVTMRFVCEDSKMRGTVKQLEYVIKSFCIYYMGVGCYSTVIPRTAALGATAIPVTDLQSKEEAFYLMCNNCRKWKTSETLSLVGFLLLSQLQMIHFSLGNWAFLTNTQHRPSLWRLLSCDWLWHSHASSWGHNHCGALLGQSQAWSYMNIDICMLI